MTEQSEAMVNTEGLRQNSKREAIPQEEIAYEVIGECLKVYLPEEVDDHNCRGIREDLDNLMKMHYISEICFDFSKTIFMDSSGIGVLLGRCRVMQERGGLVSVEGESNRIERILKLSGIYHVVKKRQKQEEIR